MPHKNSIWRSGKRVRETDHSPAGRGKSTHFGFKQVPVDDKVKWVGGHFNTVARKYDLMNTLLSFGIHHLWKRQAVKMLGLQEGDRVIDVCGGTGDLSLLSARYAGPSGRISLYDINRSMIEMGRPKVAKSTAGAIINFFQGDSEQISFKSDSFDAAMVGFGIRNLTNMEAGFREIHRVLKPGGKLMCLEFSKPTAPLFRWLYDIYSLYIMPVIGFVIVGSKQAYTYLPQSIRMFPLPDEITAILRDTGFHRVVHQKLTNGIAVIHLGEKPHSHFQNNVPYDGHID